MKKKKKKIIRRTTAKKIEKNFSAIIWQTHEFNKFEPWKGWYLAVALLLILVLGVILYFHAFSLIIGLFIIVLLIALEINLEPRLVRVEINDFEVKFGEKRFAYNKIKSYSITKLKEKKHLVLHTVLPMMSFVDIPIGKQTEEELRTFLNKHIPYFHLEKHPIDRLIFWR